MGADVQKVDVVVVGAGLAGLACALEAARSGLKVLLPPKDLCTDNGAIVAAAGSIQFRKGSVSDLSVSPYSTRSYGSGPVA